MTLQNIKISLRTDDLSSWTALDPVLKYGELAVVNDISAGFTRFKVGDGTSQFNQLPFVNQIKVITDLLEAGEVQAQHISQGTHANSVPFGLAAGYRLSANANYSQALGFKAQTSASHDFSFTWNGNDEDYTILGDQYYTSHGRGTFNINPLSGADGFYIGDESLASMLSAKLEAIDVSMSYDTNSHAILLSSSANVTSVDCADFIKDGMLSTAELCGTTLVLSFNADANVQPISVELSSFVDNYDSKISDLSSAIDGKITIDDRISNICQQSDLSIVKLNASDYEDLVATSAALSNALYIVEDEFEDAYGQQIKNMAPGTDLSDAVNLEQLLSGLSTSGGDYDAVIQELSNSISSLSTDVHELSTSLSNYYIKSETSSAGEISSALSAKADLSSIEHVVQYEQDYNGNYTAATIGSRRSSLSTDIGPNSFVNGYNCVADEENTHAEGCETSAMTWYSHAEGGFTRADGPVSHVEGVKTVSELSDFQSFVWQGTDVMPQELTDITPSTWPEYKAHGPGTFNINPVSGAAGVYIGEQTLASMLGGRIESIEWADLTSLVQTSALNPGAKYRITDYVTTIDQTDCSSAMHPFDLIVTAIDRHTLDEHAIATLPSNGDDYFDAREFHVPAYAQYLEYARVPLESWEIKYCLDNDKTRFKFADTENGKGVIYYMKDEFGNEAPYDFKNVQFKRYKITSSPGASSLEGTYGLAVGSIEVDESDEMWCYTFNGADYEDFGLSEPYDFSGWHVRPTQAVLQQFGGPSVERLQECTGNVIQARQEDATDFSQMSFKLPSNVFHCALTHTPVDELPFLKIGQCAGNKLGLNCYNNTFGHSQLFNILGDFCYSNTFGNNCYSNTFGNQCYSNTFGNQCNDNTFGDGCYSNTFGNQCYSNTFGNQCYSNTFGNYCNDNTFVAACGSNTFGNNCYSNTFGNQCNDNTFGDGCYSNTFGDNCSYIKFASAATSDPSQAKGYYMFITVDSGNKYILLNCTQSTYGGNEYKNVRILPGVNNSTDYKTITDSNVNQSFCTTYQPANSQVIAV